MTAIVLVFVILLVAIVLFATEWVPVEVTSLTVVCLLTVTRVLSPAEAFAGFGNETVIFIFALLAMTEGLVATGLMNRLGARFSQLGRLGQRGFLLAVLTFVAVLSAFVSNTVTTAALLPATIHAARAAGVRRSAVLMPLAFASMLGGMTFLYGTSTNLVVSARLEQLGLGRIGLVELTPVGLPAAVVGILFLVLLGPRLLRGRGRTGDDERRAFVSEARVLRKLAGRSIGWMEKWTGLEARVVRREGEVLRAEHDLRLAAGDVISLRGRRRDILRLRHLGGLEISPLRESAVGGTSRNVVAEGLVLPSSELVGRSLGSARFSDRHGVMVLGLYRHPSLGSCADGQPITETTIHAGDLLLLGGRRESIERLAREPALLSFTRFAPLGGASPRKMALAAVIFVGALVVGSTGILPLSAAGLAGVLAMIFTRCLDPGVAFRIDWRVVLLIGSMMALGVAVENSGAGAFIGDQAARLAGVGGPLLVLAILMVVTVVLSIPMSNQAAALVMLPVALSAASTLGVDPRAFAMGIALAATCSFVTPLEPSCLLVFGPGRYRFFDFLKVGGPLTVAVLAMLLVLVPLVWPF